MSDIKKNISNERGQVVIIVALLLISLLGMTALVVDVGSIYEERRQTQTVADAAALAGAQDLPEYPEQAIQTAIAYAGLNGVDISEDNIQIYESYVPYDTITVTPTDVNTPLFFARVLGVNSVTVNATATAIVGKPKALSNLVPWGASIPEGVDWKDWLSAGDEKILKFGAGGVIEGNFYALDLDGQHGGGSSSYTYCIINGYDEPLKVGDMILPETGNMHTTVDATVKRVGESPENWMSFDDMVKYNENGDIVLDKNNGQFVMVPVIYELEDPHGQSQQIEILAFAPFILTEIRGPGGQAEIVGKFIDQALIVTEGGIDPVEPKGFRVIRLTR